MNRESASPVRLRSIFLWIGALTAIFTVVLWPWPNKDSDSGSPSATAGNYSSAWREPGTRVQKPEQSPGLTQTNKPDKTLPPPDQANATRRHDETLAADRGVTGLSIEPSTNSSGVVDKTVIGRPLVISKTMESVLNVCRERVLGGRRDYCLITYNKLAALSQEPRDTTWAKFAEKEIRLAASREQTMQFQVRNVECRTTICAGEFASPFGIPSLFSYEHSMEIGIVSTSEEFGHERGPAGEKIVVTLRIFEKR